MIRARVAASALLCDAVLSVEGCMGSPGGFRRRPPPLLVFLFFTRWFFAAFMHTHDPLSMTPPSFPLLRTPSTPDPHTPTTSSDLAVFVAFFFSFSCYSGHCWHPLFFSTLIPLSSFTTPTISNYLLTHPTYNDTINPLLRSSIGPSLCNPTQLTYPSLNKIFFGSLLVFFFLVSISFFFLCPFKGVYLFLYLSL